MSASIVQVRDAGIGRRVRCGRRGRRRRREEIEGGGGAGNSIADVLSRLSAVNTILGGWCGCIYLQGVWARPVVVYLIDVGEYMYVCICIYLYTHVYICVYISLLQSDTRCILRQNCTAPLCHLETVVPLAKGLCVCVFACAV